MSVKYSRTRRIKDLLYCLLCSKLSTANTESAQPIRASHRGREEDSPEAHLPGVRGCRGNTVISRSSPAFAEKGLSLSLLLRKTIFTTSDLQNVAKYVPRGASLMAQTVKNLPAMQETQVRSLDGEDPLEIGMTTHSSILSWKIPWTEEPGGLQSMGWQRLREY